MESRITAKNVGNLCRICLKSSKNLSNLTTPIEEKVSFNIHNMLEAVTLTKVVLNDKKFPSKICQNCLSLLKIAYEFQMQFKSSQELLQKIADDAPIVSETSPVAVELIYGEKKFDLNDVLIVEEETKDKFAFDGFLKNLGTEISARFVAEDPPQPPRVPDVVSYELTGRKEQLKNKKIDISQLKVIKYPKECKLVIEEKSEPHKIIKTLYECPTCSKIVHDLETHNALNHSPRLLICEKCGHFAQTQSQLYHHMQKHKGKRFECDQCEKKYDSSSRLKVHQEVHKNQRRFLCNVCGKNFNYAISLTYHLRLHDEKKLICNFCGLKYRMANTLKRHLRTHTKDRPYRCDFCLKMFPSRGEKLSHEMIHTGVRPYHCEYCGKGFIKSVNLKSHYLSHAGAHQCGFCWRTFVDVKFLKVHMKRVHREDEIVLEN